MVSCQVSQVLHQWKWHRWFANISTGSIWCSTLRGRKLLGTLHGKIYGSHPQSRQGLARYTGLLGWTMLDTLLTCCFELKNSEFMQSKFFHLKESQDLRSGQFHNVSFVSSRHGTEFHGKLGGENANPFRINPTMNCGDTLCISNYINKYCFISV